MNPAIRVRRATENDVAAIHRLLEFYADRGIVLRRTREDILERLANFVVAVDPADASVVGCGAVRPFGGGLYEVRSLAVLHDRRGEGIGRAMVEFIVAAKRDSGEEVQLFTLTCEPRFFERLGFTVTDREKYPPKIWSDCRNCPRNRCCNETALEIRIVPPAAEPPERSDRR